MRQLEISCPVCNKRKHVATTKWMERRGVTQLTFSCGHRKFVRERFDSDPIERDEMWDKLYPFQKEGVEFTEAAGYRCLIADEMGLGKTVQALMAIRYNRKALAPVLYIVRSNVKYQWQQQISVWLENGEMMGNMAQVIEKGTDVILPIVDHVIISMDMLSKFSDKIVAWKPHTLIIDESQNFKSLDSARTTALMKVVKDIDARHIMCLSGTPIMNRASEFFTTLNLMRPSEWPYYSTFLDGWCGTNNRGTGTGGLNYWKRDEFFAKTSRYIIRREKRDVMKHLPKFTRNYEWIKIEDDKLKEAYNKQLKGLERTLAEIDALKTDAFTSQMNILAYLTKLRQITALSKIPWLVEYVESFLTDKEKEKIIVGIHHEIVSETLIRALNGWNPILLTGKDTPQKKHEKKTAFVEDAKRRVMVASVLAAGEGLDGLQLSCSHMVLVERQWNLAKETQFEARLDRHGQTQPVTNTLLLAKGTVDEYFTEMVLEKQEYVLSATSEGDNTDKMERLTKSLNYRDLAEKCVSNRL